MERRKYLGGVYKDYIKTFQSETCRVDDQDIKGYVSLVRVGEVNRPFVVGEIYLYNNGYSELNYLPDDEHWYLSAIYDDSGNIVEWYVDITRKNAVDEEGRPYCDDLYLDAALMPDGKIRVLDEDEIKDALDQGNITRQEFEMAYRVLNELRAKQILGVAYMERLCSRLLSLFA
ncbi:MAG: DUF402 domain-containing protein [Chloroflexi bacterium]|nr:DUF402 domain-containing protein [Chloroflexota bacterium]